jgi:hypothetical protein
MGGGEALEPVRWHSAVKRAALVRSVAVSDAAKKVGGDETQPIMRAKGIAMSCGLSS